MATDNPLGLEPSELAASKRAKEAAAARAAAAAAAAKKPPRTDAQVDREAAAAAAGSATPIPTPTPTPVLSTNQKIAQTIAAYAAANPAPKGFHYGTTLGADGKPILYSDVSSIVTALQGGGGSGSGAGGPAAKKAIGTTVITVNGQQKQIITFDDGTTTTQDLGTDTANQAARTNIFDAAKTQMKTWGLYKEGDKASDALLKQLQDLATSGAGADTISLALQQSDAYKARFIGNATRQANGMSVLSPAQYIQWENDLQSVLQAAGVPKGFYAGTDEMAKLIGANVNYQVLQNRVDLAAKSIADTDPFYTQQLQNLYGVSQGDMIAHVLDPSVAMPLLQKQVAATTVAAEAARQGTNINLSTAEQLAGQGVTQAQAQQGFQAIAAQEPAVQALASRYAGYGAAGDQGAALQTAIFGAPGTQTQAQAEAQLKRLQTQEASTFGGSAGAGKGSLGIADTSGLS